MSENNAERLPGGSADGMLNEAGPKVFPAPPTPEHKPDVGGPGMPDNAGIIDSSESASNSQQQNPTGNWKSIGSLADVLKAKCEGAIRDGNFEIAEAYHAKLIDVEVGE